MVDMDIAREVGLWAKRTLWYAMGVVASRRGKGMPDADASDDFVVGLIERISKQVQAEFPPGDKALARFTELVISAAHEMLAATPEANS